MFFEEELGMPDEANDASEILETGSDAENLAEEAGDEFEEAPDPSAAAEEADSETVTVAEDLWADLRDAKGDILGRYKNVDETFVRSVHEMDREIGRLKRELGLAKSALETAEPPPPSEADHIAQLQRMTQMLPERLLLEMPDVFRDYFTRPREDGGFGGAEEDLEILTEAGVDRVQRRLADQLRQYEEQALQEQRLQEEHLAQARAQFEEAHPDVQPWVDVLLTPAVDYVQSSGVEYRSVEEVNAAIAERIRAILKERGVNLTPTPSIPPAEIPRKPVPRSPIRAERIPTGDRDTEGETSSAWYI